MKRAAGIMLGAAAALAATGGCAQQARSSGAAVEHAGSVDVVMPSTELMEIGLEIDGLAWEFSRNDRLLGVDGDPGVASLRLLEVSSVDRRWTIRGRVHESSRTTTRTLQRGVLRSE